MELAPVIDTFCKKIVSDPILEQIWISALGQMEVWASEQILRNLTSESNPEEVAEIQNHAEDELRHGQILANCVTLDLNTLSPKYAELRKKFLTYKKNYLFGYFSHPSLVSLNNKRAAYIHAAITIEKFPFQVYTVYYHHTKVKDLLDNLPGIIADERAHLDLGNKLRNTLPEDKKLPLSKLHQVEKEMTFLYFHRLNQMLDDVDALEKGALWTQFTRLVRGFHGILEKSTPDLHEVAETMTKKYGYPEFDSNLIELTTMAPSCWAREAKLFLETSPDIGANYWIWKALQEVLGSEQLTLEYLNVSQTITKQLSEEVFGESFL